MLDYIYITGKQKHPNNKMEAQKIKSEEITFRKDWIETIDYQIELWQTEIARINEQISTLNQRKAEQYSILQGLEAR